MPASAPHPDREPPRRTPACSSPDVDLVEVDYVEHRGTSSAAAATATGSSWRIASTTTTTTPTPQPHRKLDISARGSCGKTVGRPAAAATTAAVAAAANSAPPLARSPCARKRGPAAHAEAARPGRRAPQPGQWASGVTDLARPAGAPLSGAHLLAGRGAVRSPPPRLIPPLSGAGVRLVRAGERPPWPWRGRSPRPRRPLRGRARRAQALMPAMQRACRSTSPASTSPARCAS